MSFDTDTGDRRRVGIPAALRRNANTLRTPLGSLLRRRPVKIKTYPAGFVKGLTLGEGGIVYHGARDLIRSTDVNSTIPTWVDPPASASSPGTPGQMAYDGSYLYLCSATNTWRRVAHSTF